MDCQRCGKIIRKRFPSGASEVEAACECGAQYKITDQGDNKVLWEAQQRDVACPMPTCGGKVVFWRDAIKPGTAWNCPDCATPLFIAMIVKKDDNPPIASSQA